MEEKSTLVRVLDHSDRAPGQYQQRPGRDLYFILMNVSPHWAVKAPAASCALREASWTRVPQCVHRLLPSAGRAHSGSLSYLDRWAERCSTDRCSDTGLERHPAAGSQCYRWSSPRHSGWTHCRWWIHVRGFQGGHMWWLRRKTAVVSVRKYPGHRPPT